MRITGLDPTYKMVYFLIKHVIVWTNATNNDTYVILEILSSTTPVKLPNWENENAKQSSSFPSLFFLYIFYNHFDFFFYYLIKEQM